MDPADIIRTLHLQPHPEGGWYGETWRDDPDEPHGDPDEAEDAIDAAWRAGGWRPYGSAIYFLLEAGQTSAWHRVDATEIWHFYAGATLELRVANADAESEAAVNYLGTDLAAGQRPQIVVPDGAWQTARSLGEWTLVGCTVSPAFSFDGFELAPPDWQPGSGPPGG